MPTSKSNPSSRSSGSGQAARGLREILTVARFDLRESIWSRKFLVLVALYGMVVVLGTLLFLWGYDRLDEFAEEVVVGMGNSADQAKQVVDSVDVHSEATQFLAMFVENEAAAERLLEIPPLAIFHAFLGYLLVPLIVVLTSSDCIANELATGSSRYAFVRVPRWSWALGKLGSQTLLMCVGIMVATVAAYATGMIYDGMIYDGMIYNGMDDGLEGGVAKLAETAVWMLRSGVNICVYGFAFVGLTVGLSQLTESRHAALAGALGLRFVFWVLSFPFLNEARPALRFFVPDVHNAGDGLWNPELGVWSLSMLQLILMGFVFFGLGYLRLGRRDA